MQEDQVHFISPSAGCALILPEEGALKWRVLTVYLYVSYIAWKLPGSSAEQAQPSELLHGDSLGLAS